MELKGQAPARVGACSLPGGVDIQLNMGKPRPEGWGLLHTPLTKVLLYRSVAVESFACAKRANVMKHTHTLPPRHLFTAAACLLAMHSFAQNTGDYRSAGSGDWSAAPTWQIFDGSSFVAAPSAPESSDGVITIRTNHIVTQSGDITVDQVVVQVGGSLIHNGGVLTLLNGTGTDLSVEGTWSMSGGTLAGPGTAQASNVGSFNWSGGVLGTTAVVNIGAGASATFNGAGQLVARGTINNAGTVTLIGGGLSGLDSQPATFNNLPNAVVDLNGWTTNGQPWHMVTNNQGTITKNNGTVPFTFGNDFSGKAFNNLAGGVLNVATGACVFSVPTTNEGSMTGGGDSLIKLDGSASRWFLHESAWWDGEHGIPAGQQRPEPQQCAHPQHAHRLGRGDQWSGGHHHP